MRSDGVTLWAKYVVTERDRSPRSAEWVKKSVVLVDAILIPELITLLSLPRPVLLPVVHHHPI